MFITLKYLRLPLSYSPMLFNLSIILLDSGEFERTIIFDIASIMKLSHVNDTMRQNSEKTCSCIPKCKD